MTHENYICEKCDIYHKCETHDMCHTVIQCDTQWEKNLVRKMKKNDNWGIKLDIVTFKLCDTVTPLLNQTSLTNWTLKAR
jgi:hypothetical protein